MKDPLITNLPIAPTPEMIEAGAKRLANWQDDTVWPESFSDEQLLLWRTMAERVWRSMWIEATQAIIGGLYD